MRIVEEPLQARTDLYAHLREVCLAALFAETWSRFCQSTAALGCMSAGEMVERYAAYWGKSRSGAYRELRRYRVVMNREWPPTPEGFVFARDVRRRRA